MKPAEKEGRDGRRGEVGMTETHRVQGERTVAHFLRPFLPPFPLRTVVGDVLAEHEYIGDRDELNDDHACKGAVPGANEDVAALWKKRGRVKGQADVSQRWNTRAPFVSFPSFPPSRPYVSPYLSGLAGLRQVLACGGTCSDVNARTQEGNFTMNSL